MGRIQFSAKNIFFEMPLQELVMSNHFVEGFSPLDMRVMTFYACVETYCPTFRIESYVCTDDNQEIFNLINSRTKQSELKTAEEISMQKALIKKLSPEDAYTIGFMVGTKNVLNEKKQIDAINKDQKKSA